MSLTICAIRARLRLTRARLIVYEPRKFKGALFTGAPLKFGPGLALTEQARP
jgi:hypothetical protein